MFRIKDIKARQILDSRGDPTVEVDLLLDSGAFGRASVPGGASVGSLEACELRDGDQRCYRGKGVLLAVHNVNTTVRDASCANEFCSQEQLDRHLLQLDATQNKSALGANAILAVSIAFAKAASAQSNLPLFKFLRQYVKQRNAQQLFQVPQLMLNLINGGAHADNDLDVQEFMIIPQVSSCSDALQIAYEVFQNLKSLLKAAGHSTNVGDEGGLAPNLSSTVQALDVLSEAILKSGLEREVALALDVAANELYDGTSYNFKGEGLKLSSAEMISYYGTLLEHYPICSIEDPLAENDLDGWRNLTEALEQKVLLVGDDLFVTNTKILRSCVEQHIANALLIKMNQIGTLTETLEAAELANASGYATIVSHRSGETEDTTIAHLAVALNSRYIKAGSICRTDRVCKYNELLRITECI